MAVRQVDQKEDREDSEDSEDGKDSDGENNAYFSCEGKPYKVRERALICELHSSFSMRLNAIGL